MPHDLRCQTQSQTRRELLQARRRWAAGNQELRRLFSSPISRGTKFLLTQTLPIAAPVNVIRDWKWSLAYLFPSFWRRINVKLYCFSALVTNRGLLWVERRYSSNLTRTIICEVHTQFFDHAANLAERSLGKKTTRLVSGLLRSKECSGSHRIQRA